MLLSGKQHLWYVSAFQDQVIAIVREAGERLMRYRTQPLTKTYKSRSGFATQADYAIESWLVQELTKMLPASSWYGEESGRSGVSPLCWVIDPLDGTTNFARGLPYFCVSVALTYHDEPVFGIIYQSMTQELFHAVRGQGAFCNGRRLENVQKKERDIQRIIAVTWMKNRFHAPLVRLMQQHRVYAFTCRQMGAVALDCAYVAAGAMDGLLFMSVAWWDVAAGVLLLTESGNRVTEVTGGLLKAAPRVSLVAGEPGVQAELVMLLRTAKGQS